MKIQNNTGKEYFLIFQKVLEFKKFCGVASSKSEAVLLKKMLQQEKPNEKFIIVKIKNQEVKRI
jgi:hypothetical protein